MANSFSAAPPELPGTVLAALIVTVFASLFEGSGLSRLVVVLYCGCALLVPFLDGGPCNVHRDIIL